MVNAKYNRFDPFKDFKVLSDSIFTDFLRDVNPSALGKDFPVHDQTIQEDGSILLEFALAGYSRDQLKVEVQDGLLKISGTAAHSADSDNAQNKQRKLARRSFLKTLSVADDLDLDKVEAKFVDGLLEIKIPAKQIKPYSSRLIEVK